MAGTGAQFCGLALVETKKPAEEMAAEIERKVTTPDPVRIHWTGCPNSCGQVRKGHPMHRTVRGGDPFTRRSDV